jgi:cell division protein FtsZ
MVYRAVDPEVNLIHGVVIDPTLNSGEVMITLIATGFDQSKPNVQRKVQRPAEVPAPQDEPPASPEPATLPASPIAEEAPTRRPAAPPVPQPRPLSLSAHATRHQDGNDLDVPPFLRRRAERKQQPAETKDH